MGSGLHIKSFPNFVHFYLNNDYLGMLVFSKGEVSDFRAVVRKNRVTITKENLMKILELSLYTLLNPYLTEKKFIDDKKSLEEEKSKIVRESSSTLVSATNEILEKQFLQEDNI